MSLLGWATTVGAIVTILLVILVLQRPRRLARGGMILGFVVLFLSPLLVTVAGSTVHLEQSKSTEFCLSCHVMEPYGESFRVDDAEALPAAHFQNRRVPRDQACFTCHTTYTMFGDYQAKIRGVRHLLVHYFGDIPEQIELYEPYQNRECLHCHEGARSYEDDGTHADLRAELQSGEISCLDCHDVTHEIDELDAAERWQEVP